MKKYLLATAVSALAAGSAIAGGHEGPVKVGVMLAFTGPLESLAPPIGDAADVAVAEVNAAGGILGGRSVEVIRGDSTCEFAQEAVSAAERLVTSEGIVALVGAMCSPPTTAVLQSVSIPNGIVQISPSATAPGLSVADDNGLFFRLAPSDARQGELMAQIVKDRGFESVAVTHLKSDYGVGLADNFVSAFQELGGTVSISAAHDEGKADYSAELAALDAAGGEVLVVAGYAEGSGASIIQTALDTGAFETFVLPDGMVSSALTERFGTDIEGSFGQLPSSQTEGAASLENILGEAGIDGTSIYAREGYDSAALLLLAMQAAGSTDGAEVAAKVMDVANSPGEPIGPGELAKGLEILAAGGDIDYVGGSDVELIEPGEAGGGYREIEIKGGEIETIKFH